MSSWSRWITVVFIAAVGISIADTQIAPTQAQDRQGGVQTQNWSRQSIPNQHSRGRQASNGANVGAARASRHDTRSVSTTSQSAKGSRTHKVFTAKARLPAKQPGAAYADLGWGPVPTVVDDLVEDTPASPGKESAKSGEIFRSRDLDIDHPQDPTELIPPNKEGVQISVLEVSTSSPALEVLDIPEQGKLPSFEGAVPAAVAMQPASSPSSGVNEMAWVLGTSFCGVIGICGVLGFRSRRLMSGSAPPLRRSDYSSPEIPPATLLVKDYPRLVWESAGYAKREAPIQIGAQESFVIMQELWCRTRVTAKCLIP
jgi:hypothetical protein